MFLELVDSEEESELFDHAFLQLTADVNLGEDDDNKDDKKADKKKKKKDKSTSEESSTDDARHKAHKAEKAPKKIAQKDRGMNMLNKLTLKAISESAKQAKENAEKEKQVHEKHKEAAKKARDYYEEKYDATVKAGRDYHRAKDEFEDVAAQLKRVAKRLETTKHEALHEAIIKQKAEVKRRQADVKELRDKAREEAIQAAIKAGGSPVEAANAAKIADRINTRVTPADR